MVNIIMWISGIVLLGVIISSFVKAWNSDTYDVTGLSENGEA